MPGNCTPGEIHLPGDFGNFHSCNNIVVDLDFLMWRHTVHEAFNSFLGVIHCSVFSTSQVFFTQCTRMEMHQKAHILYVRGAHCIK